MSVDVDAPTDTGADVDPGLPPVRVTAVLVVHDGAEWLPRTLAALAGSHRRPDLVVAVDAGSTDRGPVVLDTAVGSTPAHVVDAVVTGERRDGFGASVARALAVADGLRAEALARDGVVPGAGGRGAEEWVWLLHDDSAPEPDALQELLGVVRASPTLAVAGCKQRDWDDPARLVEIGATVSPGGRRLTDVAVGDIDQGQHDSRGDVLLVSTAGMLLRRSVLEHVGGFDPSIPLVGDDVDLCLRVRRAGHRVAVVPTAVVRHAAALERGARPADALHGTLSRRLGAQPPRAGGPAGGLESARRRHWLHARLVQAPAALLPVLWLWILLVAPVRAAAWLLRGHPGRALAELDATARLLVRAWRVVTSRWRSRRSRAVPVSALRLLQRSRSQVLREDLDAWRARRSLGHERSVAPAEDEVPLEAVESGPVDDDLIDLDLGASGPARRFFAHPLTYLVPLLLALGALPPLRRQLEPVPVDAAGAEVDVLDPTAGLTAVELASRALTGWRDVGLGAVGAADPATAVWAGLTALASLLGRGSVEAGTLGDARAALLVLAPVLALLAAYAATRHLVRSRAATAAAAATWALLPSTGLLGAHHAGDVAVHVLLPLLLLALAGSLGRRPVRSVAAAGLLGAVVVALVPATWPVLVVVAVLLGVVGGERSLASWRACLPLVAVAVPALVWAPWLPVLRRDPRVLLLDPAGVDPTLVTLPAGGALLRRAREVVPVLRGESSPLEEPVAVALAVVLVLLVAAAVAALLLAVASLARARVPAAWCALAVAAAAGATGVAALLVARAVGQSASVPASAGLLALLVLVGLLVRDLHDPDRPDPVHAGPARRRLARAVRVATPLGVASSVAVAVAVALLVPPVEPPEPLPPAALVGAQSAQATRTLLLGPEPGAVPAAATGGQASDARGEAVRWQVTAGQPGPGQASVATELVRASTPTRPGERRLGDVVASLLGDGDVPGGQVAGALAELGVGWVVVDRQPDVDTALAQRAGLVRTAVSAGRTTWRVDSAAAGSGPVPARARVVGADGEDLGPVDLRAAAGLGATGLSQVADGPVPAGSSPGDGVRLEAGEPGRLLVLADNARAGWRAGVDGAELSRTTVDGWAQGFLLPATAGELEVRAPMSRPATTGVSLAALALLVVLLLWPGRLAQPLPQPGRRPAPAPASRPSRLLRRAGRTGAAVLALAVTAVLLAVATGVGVGPGAWQGDRAVRGLLAGVPGGSAAGDRAADLLDALPLAPDAAAAAPTVALAAAGSVQACATPGADGAVTPAPATAPDGSVSRGLTVQVQREGDDRGLRLAGCPTTAVRSWAVLAGTSVGQRPRLLLANPGETGAVVDVRLGGPEGPVPTPASTGLLVGPGERSEVALDALAPDLAAVLVSVVARSGTVAVTATETGLSGLVPQGGDSVPAQSEPSTDLVLPGVLVPGDGSAELLVGAVGADPAVVRVRAVAADGTVTDVPGSSLLVAPAGGVVVTDLSDLAPGGYALHLSADVPVVATASWTRQRDGEPAEGLTGVPRDVARVQATAAERAWSSPVQVPLDAVTGTAGALDGLALVLVAGGTEGTAVGTTLGAGEGTDESADGSADERADVVLLDVDGAPLASRAVVVASGGAPLRLELSELVGDVDPGLVGAVLVRPEGEVHLALQAALDDPDGPLVAGTTVPGAPPEPRTVLLVPR